MEKCNICGEYLTIKKVCPCCDAGDARKAYKQVTKQRIYMHFVDGSKYDSGKLHTILTIDGIKGIIYINLVLLICYIVHLFIHFEKYLFWLFCLNQTS